MSDQVDFCNIESGSKETPHLTGYPDLDFPRQTHHEKRPNYNPDDEETVHFLVDYRSNMELFMGLSIIWNGERGLLGSLQLNTETIKILNQSFRSERESVRELWGLAQTEPIYLYQLFSYWITSWNKSPFEVGGTISSDLYPLAFHARLNLWFEISHRVQLARQWRHASRHITTKCSLTVATETSRI